MRHGTEYKKHTSEVSNDRAGRDNFDINGGKLNSRTCAIL